MDIPFLWAAIVLLRFAIATPHNCTFDEIIPSKTLAWCPCYDGFFCAKLDVPLDYQDPCSSRASVPLLKCPAQTNSSDGPYQGMLLINPGGPGGSGISELVSNGNEIQTILGKSWDVVGFDPRGMWLSEPVANCSSNTISYQNITLSLRSIPRLTDEFYESNIDFGNDLGQRCEKETGGEKDAGPHMSTAVTARDMLSIVNAFAETDAGKIAAKPSSLLNYYGVSYGTFLGQTFASMFPDRVGNMVLDGVVNPEAYLANFTSECINHLDGVIATFFIYCHEAGPSNCPYYTGSTSKDIYERFNRSFAQLDPVKAVAESWSNATDLETALLTLKYALLTVAGQPLLYFSSLSQVLLDLESAIAVRELQPWIENVTAIVGDPTPSGIENPEWLFGVVCSDQKNTWYNKTLPDFQPNLNELKFQSIIGEIWLRSVLSCTGWPIKAGDIFDGPFGGNTTTPILFVSNTYDPVTPIENSLSSAPKYKDAQVLTIDGTGHTSVRTNNVCGFAKMKAYFQSNTLPGNNSFCPLEQGPFQTLLNGTLRQNIEHAGLSDLTH